MQDIYPNASSLPDGRIYLTTGMLAHVENEAQLAMVLGHEIGHVAEEHALESLRRQRSGQQRNMECLWFRGLFSVRQDDQPLSDFNMMAGQDEKVKSEWTGGPVEAGSHIGVEQWLL